MSSKIRKILIFAGIILISFPIVVAADNLLEDIVKFLEKDKINENIWTEQYSCGFFSRDLAKRAQEENLSIGSIILGNYKDLAGHNNHIMNYFEKNGQIWVIEPQTDELYALQELPYKYYRLYPNGTQVPSKWKGNLATQEINKSQEIRWEDLICQ